MPATRRHGLKPMRSLAAAWSAAILVFAGVAILATLEPARRAIRVDPILTLRDE